MEKVSKASRLAELEKEIAETEAALKDVHGTETEVYARIVGYYRAVKHWNKGKRDEYDLRKMFTLEDSKIQDNKCDFSEISFTVAEEEPVSSSSDFSISDSLDSSDSITYEMYTKKTCPNCPPVKEFMANLDDRIQGTAIDVDTAEGLAEAAKNGVFASPTVIFYKNINSSSSEKIEIARCHNVDELQEVMNSVFETVAEKVAVLS